MSMSKKVDVGVSFRGVGSPEVDNWFLAEQRPWTGGAIRSHRKSNSVQKHKFSLYMLFESWLGFTCFFELEHFCWKTLVKTVTNCKKIKSSERFGA